MKKKELFYRYESTAPCRGDTDCPRFYRASPTGVLFGVGGPSEPAHLSTPVLVRRVCCATRFSNRDGLVE
jgi:hypothetical protein